MGGNLAMNMNALPNGLPTPKVNIALTGLGPCYQEMEAGEQSRPRPYPARDSLLQMTPGLFYLALNTCLRLALF
ncbi:MAG: hypothetical protein P8R42_10465 [Candidatus Binatia bacterium]|nr:hypothetical protein [Candidatus Binatia bacterium]